LFIQEDHLPRFDEVIYLFTNAAVVDDAIKFVTDKLSSIEPELEKHKVDDAVTVDKKHSNDIQRSEEEDKQQYQSTATTNAVL
jgi:hypothetical protein